MPRKVLTAFGRAYGALPERRPRSQQGPGRLSGSSDLRACPGRQDHLGATGPLRRDGQRQALDPGDAPGGRRHRGCRCHLPGRDLQLPDRPSRASPSPESRPGGSESSPARDRHRHQGADEIAPGIARSIRLCEPPQGLRRPDPHPRPRASPDHAHRPGRFRE